MANLSWGKVAVVVAFGMGVGTWVGPMLREKYFPNLIHVPGPSLSHAPADHGADDAAPPRSASDAARDAALDVSMDASEDLPEMDITLGEFRDRWNRRIDALPFVSGAPKRFDGVRLRISGQFVHDLGAGILLNGEITPEDALVEHLELVNTRPGDDESQFVFRTAFSCLVAVLSPRHKEMQIIGELGMRPRVPAASRHGPRPAPPQGAQSGAARAGPADVLRSRHYVSLDL